MKLGASEQHEHGGHLSAKATRYGTLQNKQTTRIDSREGQSHCYWQYQQR
jgi:hypothetical protein